MNVQWCSDPRFESVATRMNDRGSGHATAHDRWNLGLAHWGVMVEPTQSKPAARKRPSGENEKAETGKMITLSCLCALRPGTFLGGRIVERARRNRHLTHPISLAQFLESSAETLPANEVGHSQRFRANPIGVVARADRRRHRFIIDSELKVQYPADSETPWFGEIGKGPELEEYARGTNEMGIALRPVGWDFNKPCYLCHGMMGYQGAKAIKQKDQDKYNTSFN
ncbi:hypothetical protein QBC37DRAFT_399437 [Rhypophila decipiens]|uniref:Uncharacterized protein n=1 Tax=Rhypophila decipiens TaxID=261697 RepID=A0AAN6Y9D3_9PEZI|nr:hypothetical protein QBC37DRAFT_399437 [Rhypophila decipiens]